MVGSTRTPSDTSSPSVLPEAVELAALLSRVEQASGADRELDACICAGLNDVPNAKYYKLGVCAPNGYVSDWHVDLVLDTGTVRSHTPPRYTASIDAAVALVEKMLPNTNTRRHAGVVWFGPHPEARINYYEFDEPTRREWINSYTLHPISAATPALALCAALLRALQARRTDEGNAEASAEKAGSEKQPNPTPNRDEP